MSKEHGSETDSTPTPGAPQPVERTDGRKVTLSPNASKAPADGAGHGPQGGFTVRKKFGGTQAQTMAESLGVTPAHIYRLQQSGIRRVRGMLSRFIQHWKV